MTTPPASRHTALGKFAPPRLGRVFDRERLFALLDAAAPPGAGKTTLITTWLRRSDAPSLWPQLDAGDADPASFANCLQVARTALELQRGLLAQAQVIGGTAVEHHAARSRGG